MQQVNFSPISETSKREATEKGKKKEQTETDKVISQLGEMGGGHRKLLQNDEFTLQTECWWPSDARNARISTWPPKAVHLGQLAWQRQMALTESGNNRAESINNQVISYRSMHYGTGNTNVHISVVIGVQLSVSRLLAAILCWVETKIERQG